jgi:hypothetical protein
MLSAECQYCPFKTFITDYWLNTVVRCGDGLFCCLCSLAIRHLTQVMFKCTSSYIFRVFGIGRCVVYCQGIEGKIA